MTRSTGVGRDTYSYSKRQQAREGRDPKDSAGLWNPPAEDAATCEHGRRYRVRYAPGECPECAAMAEFG